MSNGPRREFLPGIGGIGVTVERDKGLPTTEFEKQLATWERKHSMIAGRKLELEQRAGELKRLPPPVSPLVGPQKLFQFPSVTEFWRVEEERVKQITEEIPAFQSEFLKYIFYEDLYSIVPPLIITGAANSVEEALDYISVPSDLDPEELAAVRDEIAQLLASRSKLTAEPQEIPELATEGIAYPELVAPVEVRAVPVTISQLSTQEIMKALKAPQVPESALTDAEWEEHLESKGWSEEDIDNELEIRKEQLLAEVINRKNLVDKFREEGATLPPYKIADFLKTAVIQPPLAALEMLNLYYEHTSMPAAGWLYSKFLPDIQKAYVDFKQSNPDATEREAFAHAWHEWDAPGPPVLDFLLKYMLMEGLTDPVTFVGWGIATRLLRSLGPFGRTLAAANSSIGVILDLPFDGIKYIWGKAIPKTVGQRAKVLADESYSILVRGLERTSGKPLPHMLPKHLRAASEVILQHAIKNPRYEDDIAMAGRALLVHPPVSEKEVVNWITRIRNLGARTINPEDVTPDKLLDIDDIFERVFTKEITVDEAAPHLMQHLGILYASDATEDLTMLTGRIFADRANTIVDRALEFTLLEKTSKALRAYHKKAVNIFTASESSKVMLAAHKAGYFRRLMIGIDLGLAKLWPRKIEQYVIRDAASSFLAFGGYGPGNTIEDVWRSVMGGVKSGRSSIERSKILTYGLKDDPNLYHAGISETMGPLADWREPGRTNWFLTMAMAPLSAPTWAVTKAVHTFTHKGMVVNPKQFAKGGRFALVDFWGGLGADIRRNFRDGRYGQILADMGGDAYQALLKVGTRDLPPELASAPKWVRRNLRNETRNAVLTGHFTPDDIGFIQLHKDRFTKDRIVKAEVDEILMKYGPDVSPTTRSLIFENYKEMFREVSPPDIHKLAPGISIETSKPERGIRSLVATHKDFPHTRGRIVLQEHPDYVLLSGLNVEAPIRGKGAGEALAIQALEQAEGVGKPVVLEKVTQEGNKFWVALEKKGLVELTPLSDKIDIGVGKMLDLGGGLSVSVSYSVRKVVRRTGPDSIDDFMRNTAMQAEVDDFLMGPERAQQQMRALADQLVALEVQHPEDMAGLITSLHRMSQTYGALPNQIMARATMKSRGLPLADRSAHFDVEFDRLYNFMEKAGADVDRVVEKIRLTEFQPARIGMVDWDTVSFKGLTPEAELTVKKAVDDLPFQFKAALKGVEVGDTTIGDRVFEAVYREETGILSFFNVEATKDVQLIHHELAHAIAWDDVVNKSGMLIKEFKEVAPSRVHVAGVTREMTTDPDEVFAELFSRWTRDPASVDPKVAKFLSERFPKAQRDLGLSEAYKSATQQYLDITTTARKVTADARVKDSAYRHEVFAAATQKDLRNPAFWDEFYAHEQNFWGKIDEQIAELNADMIAAVDRVSATTGAKVKPRPAVVVRDRPLAPADVAKLLRSRGDDISRMLLDLQIAEGSKAHFVAYVTRMARPDDVGFTKEAVGAVYDQICAGLLVDPKSSSWFRARQMQIESMTRSFHDLYNAKLLPKEQKVAIDKYIDETARAAQEVSQRADFDVKNYDQLRQSALDESHKWYYKEFTDYTNENVIDRVMKTIYPFWTYEIGRWFWLPRSFVRRPGTLTAWGRWEDNTDYGYVHIPGTSIDVHPARGNVYGPWSTRLMRRDYPEYYDELEGMGGMIGFFDFLSRYGFYPNIIYGAFVAQFGGRQPQVGGILPSSFSTPLNALIAAFPDNKLVNFISEKIFPELFRQYLTARRVDDVGGDGSLLYAKRKAGQELTPEEEAMWTDARRTVAIHGAPFEQWGMARMRSDESYAVAKAAEAFIEENWGFTPEQQKWARLHNVKLWDLVGGLDPWESAAMQELEFFKYSGSITPVLPSYQQEILNKIEIDWAEIRVYSEQQRDEILQLQQDFLVGSERGRLTPDTFLSRVRALYDERRRYIDRKVKDNPLMLLENRAEYYEKYGQTMPVQSPYSELMSMYFSIELEDTVDPGTGERIYDWDKFWANREMIADAIPVDDKGKWDEFITRNTAPLMEVWHDVYSTYLRKYYDVWGTVLKSYPEDEQKIVEEFLFLERTGQQLERQAAIKEIVSEKDGNQLISSFRSEVSASRKALRYANPHLDAWLFYWGRVKSFQTAQAEQTYKAVAKQTGREIDSVPAAGNFLIAPGEAEVSSQGAKAKELVHRGLTREQFLGLIEQRIKKTPADIMSEYKEMGERFTEMGYIRSPEEFIKLEIADVVAIKDLQLESAYGHLVVDKLFPGLRSKLPSQRQARG